jgi:dTDP-4-dehydrorhamnose reductase
MVGRSLCEYFHAANIPFAGLTHEEVDVTRNGEVLDAMETYRPDVIFNAAAMTGVDQCEKDRETAFESNGRAPGEIAALCHRKGIQLIHLGTNHIFNGRKKAPYNEDDAPVPANVYAESKLDGEKRVLRECPDALVVRVAWVFRGGGKTFFARLRDMLFKQERIEAANDCVANCTYGPDLATALVALARRHVNGVVHFTNEGELSWFDFAEEFLETTRRVGLHPVCKQVVPIESSKLPFVAARPPYGALDKTRYRKLTGNSIRHWRETLFDFIREQG